MSVECPGLHTWYSKSLASGQGCTDQNLIRTSICDKYSGSTKTTTRLDHISHCKTASGTNWANRWTQPRKVNIRLHEKGDSKFPWRKAGQPRHLVDVVDSDQCQYRTLSLDPAERVPLQLSTSPVSCCNYRGTSPMRQRTPLGPYRRPMPRFLGWS